MTVAQILFIAVALALIYAWVCLDDDGGDHWF